MEQEQVMHNEIKLPRALEKIDKIADILLWVIIIILIALVLIRYLVIGSIGVSGTSMYDTYVNGETVTVLKVKTPQRGDVAVFYKYPVNNKYIAMLHFAQGGSGEQYEKLIKRVVAVEGDTIWVEQTDNGKYVFVVETPDGQQLREDYYVDRNGEKMEQFTMSKISALKYYTVDNKLTIPSGCFFAMGDNREVSLDSRGDLTATEVVLFTFDRVIGTVID